MNRKFSFKIESLLSDIEFPKGPIEQVMFSHRLAVHEGDDNYNRLARVIFSDPEINKAFYGTPSVNETLLIGLETYKGSVLHLCGRSETSCLKIATGQFPDRKITFHNEYRDAVLPRKLSDNQILDIFNTVWDNMRSIQPHNGTIEG